MKRKFKVGATLFSAIMAAIIISSTTLTIAAKTESAENASQLSEQMSVQQDNADTYELLVPQDKLLEKFDSVPNVQVIEKHVPIDASEIPASLDGIDNISIKNALMIDGTENDMLRTFDNPEHAINQIYDKTSTLLDILANKYGLEKMSNDNWENYQNCMNEYINECIQNNDEQAYDLVVKDKNILTVFFDIYENTAQNQELMNQVNNTYARSNAEPLTVGEITQYLPTNTPLSAEINSIREEEKLEQVQKQQSGIQTRNADVANYFNVNRGREYALKWATSSNWNYGYMFKDCTNFASQILHEGGFPMAWGNPDYWWCKVGRYPTYGKSWINANSFVGYWFGVDYWTNSLLDFSGNIREGDFIAADYGLDWSYDHVGFVAWLGTYDWHTNSYGHNQYYRDFVVAQHTSDYQDWVSSSKNGWDDIEGKDTDSTREGRYVRVWTR